MNYRQPHSQTGVGQQHFGSRGTRTSCKRVTHLVTGTRSIRAQPHSSITQTRLQRVTSFSTRCNFSRVFGGQAHGSAGWQQATGAPHPQPQSA
jgi:hypothetical protein